MTGQASTAPMPCQTHVGAIITNVEDFNIARNGSECDGPRTWIALLIQTWVVEEDLALLPSRGEMKEETQFR